MRRYKTLCERFRRESIKQQQVPGYTSTWNLFEKFALLKDAQSSEWKTRNSLKLAQQQRFKTEPRDDVDNVDCAMALATATATGVDAFLDMDFVNDNAESTHSPNSTTYDNNINSIVRDNHQNGSNLFVEPTYVGGSLDLSTDTIAAFCQFLEANLKQFNEDQSDELIEEITLLLFRKRKEFKRNNRLDNDTTTTTTTDDKNPNDTAVDMTNNTGTNSS